MENKIRFLHTADLHLGAAISASPSVANERRQEALLTLERLFSICKTNEIPLMLISGDLLENNSVEPKFFEGFLRQVMLHPEVTVVFCAGNHDPLTADSPFLNYKIPENLIVMGTEDECRELNTIPVRIYGKSFGSVYMRGKNNFSIPATEDEKLNIMVLHGDFAGDTSGEYNPVSRQFIELSKMDYIALGHIHAFSAPEKLGKTYFAYSGTPEPHGFDETGEKGVIVGEISKTDFRYEFVPTARRRYEVVNTDISAAENSAEAAEMIKNILNEKFGKTYENNFYKVILEGETSADTPIDTDEIAARLRENIYFVKLRDNTKPRTDLQILRNEHSSKGKFTNLLLERIENADDSEKLKLEEALIIGLKAFSSQVKYNED